MRPLLTLLIGLAGTLPSTGCIDDGVVPLADAEITILFIGNSLTIANDMPGQVAVLLEAVGEGPVAVRESTAPGTGLIDHWTAGAARQSIETGDYDYVVLQQGPSATEGRPSLLEFAELFGQKIRDAGGTPALYMVWPSKAREFDFDGVSESYTMAAEAAQGVLFPAGDAWRAAWARDESLPLYDVDNFHPSVWGSYMAALTAAVVISGRSATAFPHAFESRQGVGIDIPDDVAAVLKAAVDETVAALGSG